MFSGVGELGAKKAETKMSAKSGERFLILQLGSLKCLQSTVSWVS